MKRYMLASLPASLLAATFAVSAGPAPSDDIVVMTQNQYIGAELYALIPAYGDDEAFNAAVLKVAATMARNRTEARVEALAREILDRAPHLVGLQEAWSVTCEPADAEPCTNPAIAAAWGDHLAITQGVLGSRYVVAGVVENFEIPLQFTIDGEHFGYVHVLDRDVILAREDVATTKVLPLPASGGYPCSIPSADGCNYQYGLPLAPLPGFLLRGFVVVDATVNGKDYRFVDTHLENGYADELPGFFQSAQALQLMQTLAASTPPGKRLLVVGDMNSSPNDAVDPTDIYIGATPYMLFTYGIPNKDPDLAIPGLFDAWLYRPGNVAGLTCCQLEDLSNRVSILNRRVDLILTGKVPARVKDARLIGEVAADRLRPPGRGLWPSDHAAVAAGLKF